MTPRIIILKSRLGSKSWFSVYFDGLECSRPIDTLPEAIQWVKDITEVSRVGVYRMTDDLTEVIL